MEGEQDHPVHGDPQGVSLALSDTDSMGFEEALLDEASPESLRGEDFRGGLYQQQQQHHLSGASGGGGLGGRPDAPATPPRLWPQNPAAAQRPSPRRPSPRRQPGF